MQRLGCFWKICWRGASCECIHQQTTGFKLFSRKHPLKVPPPLVRSTPMYVWGKFRWHATCIMDTAHHKNIHSGKTGLVYKKVSLPPGCVSWTRHVMDKGVQEPFGRLFMCTERSLRKKISCPLKNALYLGHSTAEKKSSASLAPGVVKDFHRYMGLCSICMTAFTHF